MRNRFLTSRDWWSHLKSYQSLFEWMHVDPVNGSCFSISKTDGRGDGHMSNCSIAYEWKVKFDIQHQSRTNPPKRYTQAEKTASRNSKFGVIAIWMCESEMLVLNDLIEKDITLSRTLQKVLVSKILKSSQKITYDEETDLQMNFTECAHEEHLRTSSALGNHVYWPGENEPDARNDWSIMTASLQVISSAQCLKWLIFELHFQS